MAVAYRTITRIQDADDVADYVLLAVSDFDSVLKGWAAGVSALLSGVTRTDYSETVTLYTGELKRAGSIHVQATVNWPDGETGHLDGVEYPEAPGVLQYFTASHAGCGKIVVQAPLVDGVAALTVITPDYYVDSAAGGGGAGTLASPYATFAELPALQSGDVLALKSGSHWREKLTLVTGVSVYRYGAGARPIIDASDIITGTWTNDDTYTNLWYIDVTPEVVGVTDIDTNLWVDGSYPADARSTTLAAANGAAGSWYVDNDIAATQRIHYYPAADNPNVDGKFYEFNSRGESINGSWPDDVVLDGIVCRRQRSGSGAAVLGRSAITRHCDFLDGTKHNIYAQDGWQAFGCRFIGSMWSGLAATLSVYNEATPAGIGIWNYDCYWDSERTVFSAVGGGYGHHNTSGAFGAILYDRCTFNRLSIAIDAGSGAFTGITVQRCVQRTVDQFTSLSTATSNTGTVIVQDNLTVGPGAARFSGSALALTYVLRNNYLCLSGAAGAFTFAAGTAHMYGNELLNNGGIAEGSRQAVRLSNNSTVVLRCYENRFLGPKDASGSAKWGFYWYNVDSTPDVPRIYADNNHYGDATGYAYFGTGVFNAAISTLPGEEITNVSGLAGTAGDGSQEARALIFA